MKSLGIKMALLMGVTMSLVLSFVGTLLGGHFTVVAWAISFVISLIISLVIGFIVPIRKISNIACEKAGTKPSTPKGNAISSFISDLIYTPIITTSMVLIMLNNAAKHAPAGTVPSVGRVLPVSLVVTLIVGYIVIFVAQPLFLRMLLKDVKGMAPERPVA